MNITEYLKEVRVLIDAVYRRMYGKDYQKYELTGSGTVVWEITLEKYGQTFSYIPRTLHSDLWSSIVLYIHQMKDQGEFQSLLRVLNDVENHLCDPDLLKEARIECSS